MIFRAAVRRHPVAYIKVKKGRRWFWISVHHSCRHVRCRPGEIRGPFQIVREGCRYPLLQNNLKRDRKSTRLNSSHSQISYAVFCLKKKKLSETNNLQHDHTGTHYLGHY